MTGQLPLIFDHTKYRDDFAQWLMENQPIWRRFCIEANKLWDRGRRHYGARTIIEYIRHQTALSEPEGAFKVNNNFAPDMARLYQESFPDRAALFETRCQKNARRAA